MCDFPYQSGLLEGFSMPKLGDISLPKLGDISLPKLGDISLPKFSDISLPKFGDVEIGKIGDVEVGKIGEVGGVKIGEADAGAIFKQADNAVGGKIAAEPVKIGDASVKLQDSSPVDTAVLKAETDGMARSAKQENLGTPAESKATKAKTEDTKAKSWAQENMKYIIGGLTAAIIASVALARWQAKEGREFNIVAIDPVADGVQLTLDGTESFRTDDWVDVSGTNSTPSVDGVGLSITHVVSKSIIVIPGKVTGKGTTGRLVLHTSFESQLSGTIGDAVAGVVDAGEVVAAGVIEGTTDALGLGPLLDTAKKWAVPVIIVIALVFLLMFVLPLFR
jgi:hypothetical protein